MRWTVLLAFGCGTSATAPPKPAAIAPEPGLALEVTPASLGNRPPVEPPPLTVALVNRSTTRTYSVPRPGSNAWLGASAPLYYDYEVALADGRWERLPRPFFIGHPDRLEQPGELIVLRPGERAVLTRIPTLGFPDDRLGRMRALLTYDVDAELARLPRRDNVRPIGSVVSNTIEVNQIAGPLELRLEQIGPVVVARKLDPSQVLRVTLRNGSNHEVSVYGPGGITAGVGFLIDQPDGGVWPRGDRPVLQLAPEPAKQVTLRPGAMIEVFGPRPAHGSTPGTWNYPVAETFRIRALLSQPGPQRMLYSNWVTITAKPP